MLQARTSLAFARTPNSKPMQVAACNNTAQVIFKALFSSKDKLALLVRIIFGPLVTIATLLIQFLVGGFTPSFTATPTPRPVSFTSVPDQPNWHVNVSVQLLCHLHEIGATAIHVRLEVIQLEGEQIGLGERSMEL
jgi:hypothetical protein